MIQMIFVKTGENSILSPTSHVRDANFHCEGFSVGGTDRILHLRTIIEFWNNIFHPISTSSNIALWSINYSLSILVYKIYVGIDYS